MKQRLFHLLDRIHFQKIRRFVKEALYKYQLVNWFLLPSGHRRVFPWATYSPWAFDTVFLGLFDRIKEHSLVDVYRCYELWQLVAQCDKLEGDLLEVGVWRGGTASLICTQAAQRLPGRRVYLADTFRGVVKASTKDKTYQDGYHSDTSREHVEHVLRDHVHLNNFVILEGIFPDDTAHMITSDKFCFCHIDVDTYDSAAHTMEWLWPRLPTGGIVVFDDYGFHDCSGITSFVNEERKKQDRLVIHNLNGHAIIIKK